MSVLLDVLLTEELEAAFRMPIREGRAGNSTLIPQPGGASEKAAGRGSAIRILTRSGESLVVTPRRIAREVGEQLTDLVVLRELVGYDWISTELSEKVRLKEEHYDRLYLHLAGARSVVLDRLGPAVYPLMAYLGKALELRSRKVLLPRLDTEVAEAVTRSLYAGVAGPFLTDEELRELVEQDRESLQVIAGMWRRLNLASPELHRTVEGVMEMLLQRRHEHEEAWDALIGLPPQRIEGALAVFRTLADPGD